MPREAARSAGPRPLPWRGGEEQAMASAFFTPSAGLRGAGGRVGGLGVAQDLVVRMAAADPGRLHAPGGGKVRRPEAHAVEARGGAGDGVDVLHALGGFEDRVDEDRLPEARPSLELREKLVDVVDVPR